MAKWLLNRNGGPGDLDRKNIRFRTKRYAAFAILEPEMLRRPEDRNSQMDFRPDSPLHQKRLIAILTIFMGAAVKCQKKITIL